MVGVVALAGLLRLWEFVDNPGGLLIDEGFNGVDVLRVLAGERPLFFSDNFGREPLFIYVQAVSVALLGRSAFALRFVGFAFGLLAVPTTYAAVRRLAGGRAALVAAAWVATAPWPLIFSRIGLRSIAVPCLVAAAVYLLDRALDDHRLRGLAFAACSGLAVAAAISTYTSTRIFPLVVLGVLAVAVAERRVSPARALGLLAAVSLAAAVGLAPLAAHFLHHPEDFFNRASAISVFNPAVNGGSAFRALLRSVAETLGVFVVRGDPAWDRNVSGLPAFDPLFGLLFLVGLGAAPGAARRGRGGAALLIWLVVMLVPNALSGVGVPNYLRLTGAMPAMGGLAGLGADWVVARLIARRDLAAASAAALFVVGAAWGVYWTLVAWPRSPERFHVFNVDGLAATDVATAEAATGRRVYTTGPAETHPVLAFLGLESGDRYVLFDPRFARAYPTAGAPGTVVVQRGYPGAEDLPAAYRHAPVVAVVDPAGRPAVELIRLEGETAPPPTRRLDALIGGVFQLTGYDVPRTLRPGQPYVAWVTGVARRPDPRDLVWFGHVVDRNERVWARLDQSAIRASTWRDGDVFRGRFEFVLPTDAPGGLYNLAVGLIDRGTISRLRFESGADEALLGPIWVRGTDAPLMETVPVTARWPSEGLELSGYQLERSGQPRLTLVWRVSGPPSRDYTLFVHVIGAGGAMLAQADAPPARPLSTWEQSDVVVDQRQISLPPGARAIALGLYEPETGRRLPLDTGDTVTLPIPPN